MAVQLPAGIPNFNVQQPPPFDPLAQRQKQATLSGLLDENALRKQLAPLNVQEAQEKAKQAAITTQTQQQELDSRKAMMAAIASRALNKYAGVETPDGSGFDAAAACHTLL